MTEIEPATDVDLEELARRLHEPGLLLLDVRTLGEFSGATGSPCDQRQGHIPGARNIDVQSLLEASTPDGVRALVGAEEGTEIIAYCHSGGRSAVAVLLLVQAGYQARNYVGSWHEWSADPSLPMESGG